MAKQSPEIVNIGSGDQDEVSLVDILDHVLNSGVVIRGSVIISVAGVDLIYLGVDVILSSIETALRHIPGTSLNSTKPDGDAGA
ncbi:MAG TPA: gas vesicle protein [Candidatus Dormibacteraeota bacterium]|nr:gas vesicle protein [Candidatus Dormibacteraeota bacterium]